MKKFNKLSLVGDFAPMSRIVSENSIRRSFVANVEGPILSDPQSINSQRSKAGPSMFNKANAWKFNRSICVLANNHTMDYGVDGLTATINSLQKSDCMVVGAGLNKRDAESPIFFNWAGKKAGLIARCEPQFGIATIAEAGVAAFDATIYEQIRALKREVDVVIVSIHAGAEMVPWPSPRRQGFWRSLVDAGADLIHGHHSHVPQGWEEYKGKFIFYGLGNFCVDPKQWSWHPQGLWSLVPEMELTEKGIKARITTTVIEEIEDSILVRISSDAERNTHLAYLANCNRPLTDLRLLEGLWQEASLRMYNAHFIEWLDFDSKSILKICAKRLRAKLILVKRWLIDGKLQSALKENQGNLLLRYHLFVCDSHNDAIGTALGVLGGELEDLRNEETQRLADDLMVLGE